MKGIEINENRKKCIIVGSLTIIISLLALFFFRNIIVFFVFLVVNAFLNFYQGSMELSFDLTPSLALVIIFSMTFGFKYGLIFLFFGSVIPSIIPGGFNHLTFFYVVLAIGISYLASLGLMSNVMTYGLVLIGVQTVFSFFIATFLSGDPMSVLSVFLGLILNIPYFIVLSRILSYVLI